MGRGWAAGSVDEEEKGGWRGCWATREGRERLFGGWVSIVVLGIAARRAAVGIADAYRRTFRDTECGSLTASWDGYRWWLMTGDHGDAMAGPSLGVGRRVCPAWNLELEAGLEHGLGSGPAPIGPASDRPRKFDSSHLRLRWTTQRPH
jgi:hypothetical protein